MFVHDRTPFLRAIGASTTSGEKGNAELFIGGARELAIGTSCGSGLRLESCL